jgi:hypothetical protein
MKISHWLPLLRWESDGSDSISIPGLSYDATSSGVVVWSPKNKEALLWDGMS